MKLQAAKAKRIVKASVPVVPVRKADAFIFDFLQANHQLLSNRKFKQSKGYYYSSLFDFLLQEGGLYKSKKLTRVELAIVNSALARLKIEPEKKQCYYNSQLLVLADSYLMLKFVEGFAFNGLLPVAHAWCEVNEKIIDITWTDNDKIRLGEFSERVSYFGVTIPREKILERILKTATACSLIDDKASGYPFLKNKLLK